MDIDYWDFENFIKECLEMGSELINKNDFIQYVNNLLLFYRHLFINLFDDSLWKLHDNTSTKYPIKDDEIIFQGGKINKLNS